MSLTRYGRIRLPHLVGAVVLATGVIVPVAHASSSAEHGGQHPASALLGSERSTSAPPGMTPREIQVQNAAERVFAQLPAKGADEVSPAIDWSDKQIVLRTVDPTNPRLVALTRTSMPDGFRVVIRKTKLSPGDVDSLTLALGKVEASLPAPGSFAGVSANPDFSGLQIVVSGFSTLDAKEQADWRSVAEKYSDIYGVSVTIADRGYVKDLVGHIPRTPAPVTLAPHH